MQVKKAVLIHRAYKLISEIEGLIEHYEKMLVLIDSAKHTVELKFDIISYKNIEGFIRDLKKLRDGE